MLDWIPPRTELVRDVSPADWILERLQPWDLQDGVLLRSFAPDGFEAYARIFSPVRTPDGLGAIKWGELGAARGIALTPDVAFMEVSGLDPHDGDALVDLAPQEGHLPSAMCEVLVRLLRTHTNTPARC